MPAMCGRFTNHLTWREIVELYDLTRLDYASNLRPRSDIRPTDDILILRDRGEGREAAMVKARNIRVCWQQRLRVTLSICRPGTYSNRSTARYPTDHQSE